MPRPPRPSNCSSDLPVDLLWHACPHECSLAAHVDAITEQLMAVVKAPAERRWNPYSETMTRREFRQRLVAASKGRLVPVDHVKSIEHPLAAEMFEIRWQNVRVAEVSSAGRVRHSSVHVRLLHVEPGRLGVVALGLHAHEKLVVPSDRRATRNAQDAEIQRALGVYATALSGWLSTSPSRELRRDLPEDIG